MSKPQILGLVDAENLYYTPKKQWGQKAKVDFYKLFKLITRDSNRRSQVIIYLVTDPVTNQTRFLDRLKRIGYIPKMKVLYPEKGKLQNSNWDPKIIEDALAMIDQTDKLVLVSGDGGFSPTLQEYRDHGKETAVLCFKNDFSAQLRKVADAVTFLDESILFQGNNHGSNNKLRNYGRPKPLEECRFPMQ